jgi:hypothetical protein
MYDAVNVRMCAENLIETFLICNVEIEIFGLLAADELYSIQDFRGGVVQVVCNNDFVASLEKRKCGKGANVAGASVCMSASGLQLISAATDPVIKQAPAAMAAVASREGRAANLS